MRVVAVPFARGWLGRFNSRFAVDKSSYDGRFKSRLGPGYCTASQPYRVMYYTFTELPERTKRVTLTTIIDPIEWMDKGYVADKKRSV